MKKIICFIVITALVLGLAESRAFARTRKQKDSAPVPQKASLNKTKELIEKKRSELDNTSWGIQISTSAGEKRLNDLLVFKDRKFYAERLASQGFGPVDYSLTVNDDGTTIIETMQASDREGTVFWRIELLQDQISLRGMVSRTSLDQTSQDLYFSGSKVLEAKTAQ